MMFCSHLEPVKPLGQEQVKELRLSRQTPPLKHGLGAQSLLVDLGVQAEVNVWTDSNGARAIASRRGLGKTRHVELKYLWVQEMTNSGRVKMRRVPGELNLADHLTKGKTWWEVEELVGKVGGRIVASGRAVRTRGGPARLRTL